MPSNQTPDSSTIDDGIEAIRAAGGRVTPTKRMLLELFATHPGHVSVEELTNWVQATSPEVASSTIYRIVEELETIGIVEHNHAGKGPATYHLRSTAHGHLVCHDCGTMIEAPPALYEQLVRDSKNQFDFLVDPHHFAVLGTCQDCQQT